MTNYDEKVMWINPPFFLRMWGLLYLRSENKIIQPEKITPTQKLMREWLLFQLPKYRHQPLIDRTNQCELPFNFDTSLYPLPKLEQNNFELRELMTRRAKEIVALSKQYDCKILVFYSGGVDSTAIVCSFIDLLGLDDAKKNIILCMSEESIVENPNFYDSVIKNNFEIAPSKQYHFTLQDNRYKDCIFVNGDPGGTLFGGGDTLLKLTKDSSVESLLKMDWQDVLKTFYEDNDVFEYATSCMIKSSQYANYKINDIYDYFWWFTINFRWVGICFNVITSCKQLLEKNEHDRQYWIDHNCAFYDTDYFQQWSFSNKHNILSYFHTRDVKYYKHDLKKYIYSVSKDLTYINTKGKEGILTKIRNIAEPDRAFHQIYIIDPNYKVK